MKKTLILILTAIPILAGLAATNEVYGPPRQTNYWSRMHPEWPPLPAMPSTNLPVKVYDHGATVEILVDDSQFAYPAILVESNRTRLWVPPQRATGIQIYSTNAEDIEAVRRFLPQFEKMFPGSTTPDQLPPVMLITNKLPVHINTNPPPVHLDPNTLQPIKQGSGFLPLLLVLFRRRWLRSFAMILGLAFTAGATVPDYVSSYLCTASPNHCPGDKIGHLHLYGTNFVDEPYYPNNAGVTYEIAGGVPTNVVHVSPQIIGVFIVDLDYSDFFFVGLIYPSGCASHTNSWKASELHFLGQFRFSPYSTFSLTNYVTIPAGYISAATVWKATASSGQFSSLDLVSADYGVVGQTIPVLNLHRPPGNDPTRLELNTAAGFTFQAQSSTNGVNYSSVGQVTTDADGYGYLDIAGDTNQFPKMFYRASSTNTYRAAP